MKKFICLAMLFCALATFAQNTKYVNLFMGSSGDNGQLAPGATVPFGVVCVCVRIVTHILMPVIILK